MGENMKASFLTVCAFLLPALGSAQGFALTEVISRGLDGLPGNGPSGLTRVAEFASQAPGSVGTWIVFDSMATNLTTDETGGVSNIFAYDTQSGAIKLLSKGMGGPANGGSYRPVGFGPYVFFESDASNLVANDTNGVRDIIRVEIATGRIANITNALAANGDSRAASVHFDGGQSRGVLFESDATNLVVGDDNGFTDVFFVPHSPWNPQRISVGPSGEQADGISANPTSAFGRVAFQTLATNLGDRPDTNGKWDIVARGLDGGNVLVSRPVVGEADGDSVRPRQFGSDLAFLSTSTNLVPGDTNGLQDAFALSATRGLWRVSRGMGGRQLDGATTGLSNDLFVTDARNLGGRDEQPGSEVVGEPTYESVPSRVLFAPGFGEPNGQVFHVDGSSLSTDAPNLVAGSSHAQVVRMREVQADSLILVSRPMGPGVRRLGAYFYTAGRPTYLAFGHVSDLGDAWRIVGSREVGYREPLSTRLFLTHRETRDLAAWDLNGTRARGWLRLGRLAPGWQVDTVVAWMDFQTGQQAWVLARRTSDGLIAEYPITSLGLGAARVLGRVGGRFVGEGWYDTGARYSASWVNEGTGRLGGWRVAEEGVVTWQTQLGRVAHGWTVINATRRGRGYSGRLYVRRESDGRFGYYQMDPSGVTGWGQMPSISPDLTIEHVTP